MKGGLVLTRRKHALTAVLVLLLAAPLPVCSKAPPNLSPAATRAFYNTRVLQVMDLLRNTAQDAAAQPTPLISQNTAIAITEWHQASILIMNASVSGWEATVREGLVQLFAKLPDQEQRLLSPYFQIVTVILQEVI